jgi:hypothetical protein
MVLVVASRVDDEARALVSEFPRGHAALLTPRDLSAPGWDVRSASLRLSMGTAGGERIRAASISGVVTLLPCVFAQELVHIVEVDREYVAAEMTAFLLFWLTTLTCPVLNRPTSGCLSGPNWRLEQWCLAATRIGLRTIDCGRDTRGGVALRKPGERVTVTLVGDSVIGCVDEEVERDTRLLAGAASVEVLTAMFLRGPDGFRFAGAFPFIDAGNAEVRRATVGYFERRMVA